MLTLLTFCDIPWWLTWLLPFLLGLALGWLLWSRFKSLFDQSQSDLSASQLKLADSETAFENAKKKISLLEGDLSICRGRLREIETVSSVKGATMVTPVAAVKMASGSSGNKWAAAIGTDQLQIIEGIGPKMESILKENGIDSFSKLSVVTGTELRNILNKYGDKYRIIDPNTWPQQATLAKEEQYDDLIRLQKELDTGRSDTAAGVTDSKLEKFLIKAGILKRWKQDDLKAIEGIGPKIENLLHEAGIKTWQKLSETDVSILHSILEKAGPRYQLASPDTWPKQAKLAAEGKWDDLQVYQDSLDGGKEK
jgi:predicted flap endonuclease-1-like 5' DNA nuclease